MRLGALYSPGCFQPAIDATRGLVVGLTDGGWAVDDSFTAVATTLVLSPGRSTDLFDDLSLPSRAQCVADDLADWDQPPELVVAERPAGLATSVHWSGWLLRVPTSGRVVVTGAVMQSGNAVTLAFSYAIGDAHLPVEQFREAVSALGSRIAEAGPA